MTSSDAFMNGTGWQVPCESGEHGAISPRKPRPLDLPAKHCDLMTKHEDLSIVRDGRSAQQE